MHGKTHSGFSAAIVLLAMLVACTRRPPPRAANLPVEPIEASPEEGGRVRGIAAPAPSAANGRPRGSRFEGVRFTEEASLDGAPRLGVFYERADGEIRELDEARIEVRGAEWFLVLDSSRTRLRITFGSAVDVRRTRRIHASLGAGDVWIQLPSARVDPYAMDAARDVGTVTPRVAYTIEVGRWNPQPLGRVGFCSLRLAIYVAPRVEETDPGFPRFVSGTLDRVPCALYPEYPVPGHGRHQ